MKCISCIVLLIALLFPFFVFAEATQSTNQTLLDNIGVVIDWFDDTSYQWADTMLERISAWVIVWWLESKLFIFQLSLNIAEGVVSTLGISEAISALLGGVDSKIANFIFWLKIPEAINTILSAYGVRMIMGAFS
ncbi:DUF2523 family protein [Bacterioplanoides sp.]|uniref:DUF2523 family protein n=1 Tax=Bacterioplanoides sp. TaxID=2066072 RepID=UPI003B59AA8C